MTPYLIGYIAAVVDRSDRVRLIWKSRLLFSEKDAQSVLTQWEQTMPGLFTWCTRELLTVYIDGTPGVAPTGGADGR